MDGRDHAGANPVGGDLRDELAHRAPGATTELAEKLAAMKEVGSQELGDSEGPQAVPHRLDDLFAQEETEHRSALGGARRAESAARTGESQQVLGPAGIAEDAGEAALEIAAIEEGVDDVVKQTAPAAVGPLEAIVPLALDLVVALVDQVVERGAFRSSGSIDGRARGRQGRAPPLPREGRETARSIWHVAAIRNAPALGQTPHGARGGRPETSYWLRIS